MQRKLSNENERLAAEAMASKVSEDIAELLRTHGARILEILEMDDDSKGGFTIAVKLDCSKSEPSITTNLTYTDRTTDSRTSTIDDPAQLRLFRTIKPADEFEPAGHGPDMPEEADDHEPPAAVPPENHAEEEKPKAKRGRGRRRKGIEAA